MFRKPFNKKLKFLKSPVFHTELNDNEQENISGWAYGIFSKTFWVNVMPKNARIFLITLIGLALSLALILGHSTTTVAQTIIRNPTPTVAQILCGNGCSSQPGSTSGISCTDWGPKNSNSSCQAFAFCDTSIGCVKWEASSATLGSFLPPDCPSSGLYRVPRNSIRITIR